MIFDSKLEGWPSGLRRTLGKRVEGNTSPGFESPSLRHVLYSFYKQLVTAKNQTTLLLDSKKFNKLWRKDLRLSVMIKKVLRVGSLTLLINKKYA